MKKEKIIRTINVIIIIIIVICGAFVTSIYSKRFTPSSSSKINLNFNMNNWCYDSTNDVYYQLGASYCSKPKDIELEKFDIYVPGQYLIGKKNNDGTYKCNINKKGEKSGLNAKTAPIIIGIEAKETLIQRTKETYNYEDISDYIKEGYIYIWPGMRGLKDNKKAESNEEYSNAILDGVTDLKALVRFCRFNGKLLPGNIEKIIAYGINGGGTKSAILGSSGDSELYSSKLFTIGAIMQDNDGKTISDSVNGTMCCSPTNNIEISEKAYAWSIEQYLDNNNKEQKERSKELAIQYGNYINNMKFKSEEGTLLELDEMKEGLFTGGTYYNYIKSEGEKSVNGFLKNTVFPYADTERNITFETPKDYIEYLNSNRKWIEYNVENNIIEIISLKEYANFCRDNKTLNEYNISLNEYNPYYYLSDKYNGINSSYISRYWNICILLDDNCNNFLPEENLKLILQKNEDAKRIDYTCMWTKNYNNEQKKEIAFNNLKDWIKRY